MGPGCMPRRAGLGEPELLLIEAEETKYSRTEGTKAPFIRSS